MTRRWRTTIRRVVIGAAVVAIVAVGALLGTRTYAKLQTRGERARLQGHLDAAMVFASTRSWADAEREANAALELAPDHTGALGLLGEVQAISGRSADAEATFLRVVAARPRDAVARTWLARFALARGAADEALLQIADLRRDPACTAAVHEIAASAELARGNLEAALDAWGAAAAADAGLVEPCLAAGELAAFLARTTWTPAFEDRAAASFAEAQRRIVAQPGSATPTQAARCLLALGRGADALAALRDAPQAERRDAVLVACLRAAAHALQGDLDAARREVDAVAGDAPEPVVLATRARLLAAAGDRAGAMSVVAGAGERAASPELAAVASDVVRIPRQVRDALDLLVPGVMAAPPVFVANEVRFRAAASIAQRGAGRFARLAPVLPRYLASKVSGPPEPTFQRQVERALDDLERDEAGVARVRVVRAAVLTGQGRASEALLLLAERVTTPVAQTEAEFVRGLAHLRSDRGENAAKALAAACAAKTGDGARAAALVRGLAETCDVDGAVAMAQAELASRRGDPWLLAALADAPDAAKAAAARLRVSQALDEAERLLAASPDASAFARVQTLVESAEEEPRESARAVLLTARLALARNDTAAAMKLAGELIRADPGYAAARDVLRRAASAEAARFAAKSAADPADTESRLRAASAYAAAGDPKSALEVLESAPADDIRARRAQVVLLVRLGRMRDARTLLRDLVERSPTDGALLLSLAGVEEAGDDPAAAAACCRRVLSQAGVASHGVAAALALLASGESTAEDASLISSFAEGRTPGELDEQQRGVLAALALLARGAAGEALAAADRLIEAAPAAPDPHVVAALTLARARDAAAAREHLSAALRAAPDHPVARRLIATAELRCGVAEYLAGDIARAAASLERAATAPHRLDAVAVMVLAQVYAGTEVERASDACAARMAAAGARPYVVSLFRGLVLRARGSPVEAVKPVRAAFEADPAHPLLLCAAVQTLIAAGDAPAAADLCRTRLVRGRDPSGLTQYLLGLCRAAAGDRAGAAAAFEEAVREEPGSHLYRGALVRLLETSGRTADVQRVLAAVPAEESRARADTLPRLVRLVAASANPDAALAATARFVLEAQEPGERDLERGELFLAGGDLVRAHAAFERAVEASPGSLPAYVRLLHVLWRAGRIGEAKDRFEKAARDRPADPVPPVLLGMLAEGAGDRDAAERWYRKALATAPACVVAANNLACLLGETAQGRDEAILLARRAEDAAPWSPQVLDTLGWLEHLAGRSREGLRSIRRAARMQPGSAAIRFHEAEVLAAVGSKQEACAAYQAVQELDPAFAEAKAVPSRLRELNDATR